MIYRDNEVTLVRGVYIGYDNLAIYMMVKDGTILTIVSENVLPLRSNLFVVDIYNNPDVGTWLEKNGIAKYTHYSIAKYTHYSVGSESLTYPIYELLIELPSLELYRKAHESNPFAEV